MKNKIGSYQQIRDQYYYIEIVFYNQIENEKPVAIPFFLVDSLIINESLHNFITSGQIALNIIFEGFNRGTVAPVNYSNQTLPAIKAPYIDRTDGRNKISIRIYPVGSENLEDESVFPKDRWEMYFDFVVTDIQDLPTENAQIKKRIYKFVEERYQILKERNLEWSTAQLAAKKLNKPAYKLKDLELRLNPNDILKELLSLTASNSMSLTNKTDKLKIGYDEKGTIDKPNIPFDDIDENNWDAGDKENKIKYFSPAKSTAFEDLNYILAHCASTTKDPVILDLGRTTANKKWQLIPISKFFQNSEQDQVEIMIIEDSDALDDDKSPPKVDRASYSDSSNTKNFMSSIASRIQKYKFSPMVTTDDNRIVNTALHSYDFSKGEFNIKIKQNSIKSVLEKLKELANKGLYSFKNGTKPQIILNLNKTKTTGLMFKNEFSISGSDVPEYICRNQMIMDAIFLNQSITFQVLGLTIRSPGRFIHIDRLKSSDSNPFDDRFLGQWFITKVSHLFTAQNYVTEVVAVKIDSFGKLWPEEDVTY